MARRRISIFPLFLVVATWPQLWAQTRPSVRGRVLDPTNAPVAGAQIRPISEGQPSGPSTKSDQNGDFSLSLDAGKYTLNISEERFADVSQSVDRRSGNLDLREIVLRVAPVSSTITVTEGAGYLIPASSSATKTLTPLSDVPQSITIVTQEQIKDQLMTSIGDVVRYVPGVTAIQGENNRDQLIIRGNSTSADFFVNGVRFDESWTDEDAFIRMLRAAAQQTSGDLPLTADA